MNINKELWERAKRFSLAVNTFCDEVQESYQTFKLPFSERLAVDWLRANFRSDVVQGAILHEIHFTEYAYVRRTSETLLVTPSTGMTSGIVALFWCYLGSDQVTVLPSKDDQWIPNFVELLNRLEEVTSVAIVDKRKFDNRGLKELVGIHSAVIVYGSDETCKLYKSWTDKDAVFLGYGSKTSFTIHDSEEWSPSDTDEYFRDLVSYDGLGCLNPTVIYTMMWSEQIAAGVIDLGDRITTHYEGIHAAHSAWHEFKYDQFISSRNDGLISNQVVPISRRESDRVRHIPPTRGYGTCYVVPVKTVFDIYDEWNDDAYQISTIVLNSDDSERKEKTIREILRFFSPSRVTEPGKAQEPPLKWAHDNQRNLLPLVKLVDIEVG